MGDAHLALGGAHVAVQTLAIIASIAILAGALTFEVIVGAVFGVTERERIERLRLALVSLIDMQMIFVMPNALRRDLGRFSPWGQFQRRLKAADALIYEEIDRRRGTRDLEIAPTFSHSCCVPAVRTAGR